MESLGLESQLQRDEVDRQCVRDMTDLDTGMGEGNSLAVADIQLVMAVAGNLPLAAEHMMLEGTGVDHTLVGQVGAVEPDYKPQL